MKKIKEQTLEDAAMMLLEGAKKRGMTDAKASVSKSRNMSAKYRKGVPELVEESVCKNITLSLYDGHRFSVSKSNDFRTEAVEAFLDNAAALTRAMEKDPFRELTDPALYAGRSDADLKLRDAGFGSLTAERCKSLAGEAEAAAVEAAGERFVSAEGGMSIHAAESVQLHSNGFEGKTATTQGWSYAEVSLKDEGDRRPEAWDVYSSRYAKDFMNGGAAGRRAAERAMMQIGTKKISTRKCPMIVENRAADRLLDGLLAAAFGNALQQRRSFLSGLENKRIASNAFTLIDNPLVAGGYGSRLFDSDGIAAKAFPIIEGGIFRNFYIDSYYGKKLNRAPTTGSISNCLVEAGRKSLDELAAEIGNGILVRGFIGGNSNSTTGDFSLGAYGTLIENGRLTEAVSELNISGNHRTLWEGLAATGNDPWLYSAIRSPSLLFDEIQFSGI